MKTIKVLSLFSGIGAFEKALTNIDIKHRLVGFSEIDNYAIKSYCAVHNVKQELNLGDITKIEVKKLPRFIDLITHGSPCQDFSIAGKQAGAEKGSGTRSSLMWNTIEIVEWCLPKYVIWENVKNLLSEKHKHNFDSYIEVMKKLGYNNYYKVLNAKDYGIPQNRERVYTISIRKDVDNFNFEFPNKETLNIRLKDMLENQVDEKFYLKESSIKNYNRNFGSKGKLEDKESISSTLQAAMGNGGGNVPIIQVGELDIKGHDCIKRVYSPEGVSPTLTDMQGGNRQPKIMYEKPLERKGWHRKACEVLNTNGITTCIHTQSNNLLQKIKENETCRIRKLTPKECWRLMGFDDEDFEKAANIPTSNTQLYKQAGNSIVVSVLEKIFLNLFKEELYNEKI